jgi:serine/threonine protein kinase
VKNGNQYIVTEYLSKGSLKDLLISDGENMTLDDLLSM